MFKSGYCSVLFNESILSEEDVREDNLAMAEAEKFSDSFTCEEDERRKHPEKMQKHLFGVKKASI